jgi:hypothetical protein
VPRALTSKSSSGCRRGSSSPPSARRGGSRPRTSPPPRAGRRRRAGRRERVDPLPWRDTSQSRFCSTPGRLRLSRTMTSCPSARRLSARLEPMKPLPPVTRTGRGVAHETSLRSSSCCASRRRGPRRPRRGPIRRTRRASPRAVLGLEAQEVAGLGMSAKQLRMSPTRDLPRISGWRCGRPMAPARSRATPRSCRPGPSRC